MLRFDAPGLDLGQSGEGGRVLGFDELKQLQALDRARGNGKALRGGGLLQLQHLAAAVVKFHGGPGPPGVMREVGAQGQAQLVDGDRAAKVQRECGVGVTVDAPALVGPDAVGVVLINAVDGVAGRKDSLAAGLNVGMGMGEEAGVAVLVISGATSATIRWRAPSPARRMTAALPCPSSPPALPPRPTAPGPRPTTTPAAAPCRAGAARVTL